MNAPKPKAYFYHIILPAEGNTVKDVELEGRRLTFGTGSGPNKPYEGGVGAT